MNNKNTFKLINQLGISAILFSLSATSFIFKANALPQLKEQNTTQRQENTYVAQASSCRQINTNQTPIYTRPNSGQSLGTLSVNQQVTIASEGYDGWVPIIAPETGFIEAKYLTDCTQESSDSNSSYVAAVRTNNTVNTSVVSNDNVTATLASSGGENISTVPGNNCRQVNRDNLPVMTRPMGTVVGQLAENQQVMVANEGYNGWVPIETPMSGFIQSEYLSECEGEYSSSYTETVTTVPGSNCRKILSPNVLIRKTPKGEVIGQLRQNQEVMIANEGYNGWVAIEQPTSGYITSPNLGLCLTEQTSNK